MNPTLIPGSFDDALLNQLDRNRRQIDAEDAGGFARSRTDAARELREVVGGVQASDGILPTAVIDQVVPVGDKVVDRAAGVAEGNAAVHAASALFALLLFREGFVYFEPVFDSFFGLAANRLFALDFEKSCDLTHGAPPRLPSPRGRVRPAVHRLLRPVARPARACIHAGRP